MTTKGGNSSEAMMDFIQNDKKTNPINTNSARNTVSIALANMASQANATGAQSAEACITNYKIHNQNSVYYLQPGSNELYLLDL